MRRTSRTNIGATTKCDLSSDFNNFSRQPVRLRSAHNPPTTSGTHHLSSTVCSINRRSSGKVKRVEPAFTKKLYTEICDKDIRNIPLPPSRENKPIDFHPVSQRAIPALPLNFSRAAPQQKPFVERMKTTPVDIVVNLKERFKIHPNLAQCFFSLDRDKDGVIGVEDMSRYLDLLGYNNDKDMALGVLAAMSYNKRAVDYPTFNEFIYPKAQHLNSIEPKPSLTNNVVPKQYQNYDMSSNLKPLPGSLNNYFLSRWKNKSIEKDYKLLNPGRENHVPRKLMSQYIENLGYHIPQDEKDIFMNSISDKNSKITLQSLSKFAQNEIPPPEIKKNRPYSAITQNEEKQLSYVELRSANSRSIFSQLQESYTNKYRPQSAK